MVERQRRQIRRAREHELGRDRQAGDATFGDKVRRSDCVPARLCALPPAPLTLALPPQDEELFIHPDENLDRLEEIAAKRVKLMGTIGEHRHKAFVAREVRRRLQRLLLSTLAGPGQPETLSLFPRRTCAIPERN